MTATTIDVHTHYIPQSYLNALESVGISEKDVGFPLSAWNVNERLGLQSDHGIATEVLSLSSPGLRYFHDDQKADLCRRFNDELKEIIDGHPESFGGLATLPLANADDSLREVSRAFDVLELDGVILMTNDDGVYLGDERFTPVLEELDRRGAVVFVHPTETIGNKELTFGYPAPMVEYPAETTRAIINLLDAGTITRFANIRWIFSHGGGTLPLLIRRVEEIFPWKRNTDPAALGAKLRAEIASLYWDMAIVAYEAPLLAIKASHSASKLLAGFDLPFYPVSQIGEQKSNLAGFSGFTSEEKQMIDFGNAIKLFPRIAQRRARNH